MSLVSDLLEEVTTKLCDSGGKEWSYRDIQKLRECYDETSSDKKIINILTTKTVYGLCSAIVVTEDNTEKDIESLETFKNMWNASEFREIHGELS